MVSPRREEVIAREWNWSPQEALREAGHRPAAPGPLAAGAELRVVVGGCAAQVPRASDFTCLKYSCG